MRHPLGLLDCHEGLCMTCAINCSPGKTCIIKIEEERKKAGMCLHCGKKLVPIGRSRANGKDHDDWDEREYHKKCWKLL